MIINPFSGTRRANKYLTDIVSVFNGKGYDCLVCNTAHQGHGTELVKEYAGECDMVVCIGGDGTFNEVVSGAIVLERRIPIGYIPSGSTNDFANGLGLPKNILSAAKRIAEGTEHIYDIGRFGDRFFTYIASFGAFTKTAYSTPQNFKNAFGHLAYILEGIKDISAIQREHLRIEANGRVYEDDYIFGAISNATSVGGGVLMLDSDTVDLNDGLLEALLIRYPRNPKELSECILSLQSQNYDTDMVRFFSMKEAVIYADPKMDWTLDGEREPGHEMVVVKNIPDAISMMM